MYNENGIYGKYNWSTLVIFAVAIIAQIPFMDMSFYHSYFAKVIGADVSWIPSLLIPGALYYLVNRRRGLSLVPNLTAHHQ
jgi:NCS1 family nucleobase:cation symporter-1